MPMEYETINYVLLTSGWITETMKDRHSHSHCDLSVDLRHRGQCLIMRPSLQGRIMRCTPSVRLSVYPSVHTAIGN